MKHHKNPEKFSTELENWLHSKKPKTLLSLVQFSEDKSFAVVLLIFMFLPALPIPTAAHLFEIIAALVALEMIVGLKTIWLPKSADKIKLGKTLQGKVIPAMMRRIKWLEKYSSTRAKWIFNIPLMDQLIGLICLAFIITAFIAPPLSGLDTLPSLGVVIIALAIIFDDAVALLAGTIIGSLGVGLTVALGEIALKYIKHLF